MKKNENCSKFRKDFIEAVYNSSCVKVEVAGAGEMEFSSMSLYAEIILIQLQLNVSVEKENGVETKRIDTNHLCGKCERILNDSDIYCSQCGFKIKKNDLTN